MKRYAGSHEEQIAAEARSPLDANAEGFDATARRGGPRFVSAIVRPTRRPDGRVVTPIVPAPLVSATNAARIVTPVVAAGLLVRATRAAPTDVIDASASGPRRPMLGARLVPSIIRARKRSRR